jgi:rod shape-determining protein MreC
MRMRVGLLLLAAAAALILIVVRVPQVVMLQSHAAESLSPLQSGLTGAFGWLGDLGDTLLHSTALKTDNDRLRAEIEGFRTAEVRIRELEQENELLLAQLGFQSRHPQEKLLPATIIGREPTDIIHAFTIDCGTNDGVAVGMTVVSPAGLVGRVLQAGPWSSKVLVITDTKSSVSGVFTASRAQGMVYGRRQTQLTMKYIDQMEKIEIGDWVTTSTIGGSFPPAIPIGRVIHIRQRDIEPFQEAILEPAVDFTKLERVMVITSFLPAKLE